MATLAGDSWELDLARGWKAEPDEHCTTICHPKGVGALQISAFQHRDGKVARNDLLEATLLDKKTQKHLGAQDWGDFHGFQLIYREGDTFWRKWWLAHGKTLLFVTYNCDSKDQDVEFKPVNDMVSSLRKRRSRTK